MLWEQLWRLKHNSVKCISQVNQADQHLLGGKRTYGSDIGGLRGPRLSRQAPEQAGVLGGRRGPAGFLVGDHRRSIHRRRAPVAAEGRRVLRALRRLALGVSQRVQGQLHGSLRVSAGPCEESSIR